MWFIENWSKQYWKICWFYQSFAKKCVIVLLFLGQAFLCCCLRLYWTYVSIVWSMPNLKSAARIMCFVLLWCNIPFFFIQTVYKLSRLFSESDEKLLNRGQYRFLAAVLIKFRWFAFTWCLFIYLFFGNCGICAILYHFMLRNIQCT